MTLGTPPPETTRPSRGLRWVVAQSLLMSVLIASGPMHPADWHSPAGIGVGACLVAAAGGIGIAGVIHLGRNRTPFPAPRPGSVLVRHGVYAWCRHPLYTSVLLAGFGWALLWQSGWTLLLAVVQIPFFVAKSRSEERRLVRAFPGYKEYARQVRRFLPGVY